MSNIKFPTKVRKWGDSHVIVIPRFVVGDMDLERGKTIYVEINDEVEIDEVEI